MLAISLTFPKRFKGCRAALDSLFSVLFNKRPASGVSVYEGAIQFTRIPGASSAANERVNPSIAPLEAATWV